MEKTECDVFLGFEDELIVENHIHSLNFTTNKVGGLPDWIEKKEFGSPVCKLCGLILPLIIQLYLPLENSPYHRTLYIFGCINPDCWNKKESWVCLRSQCLEDNLEISTNKDKNTITSYDWCENADVWEDEEENDVINTNENKTRIELVHDGSHFDDPMDETACFGTAFSVTAFAEIEYDDANLVTADIPCKPQVDVSALLNQVKPLPQVEPKKIQFTSFFINVRKENERRKQFLDESNKLASKVVAGQQCFELKESILRSIAIDTETTEMYEKTLPAHGDKLFHQFISKIQRNPGQLIRYIREGGSPLFLYPPEDLLSVCQHCGSDLVFELQLLPTLISRLQLVGSGTGHIEFGTVFILSCRNSCWSDEDIMRSENVLVQQEM